MRCSLLALSLAVGCSGTSGTETPPPGGQTGGTPATGGTGGGGRPGAGGTGGDAGGPSAGTGGSITTGTGGGLAGAGGTIVISRGGSAGGGTGGRGGGTGNVAGSSAVSNGGGAGTSDCPLGVVFCDDFESYAPMAQPTGKWKTWTVGNGSLVVDSLQHASGMKAAHFHGKVSQAAATKEQAFMLAQQAPSFPVSGTTFYLRFMMYGARFPFTSFSDANHTVIAWIGSTKALNAPDRGATDEGYMFADYNGISIEPMWSGYYRDTSKHFKDASQANAWHCWEIEIDNAGGAPSGGTGVARPHIWEDGVALNLVAKGGNYAAIPFEAILFSLWSPQTDDAVADYWIDDVAVSKSRIDCPAR
ncbi:MAG TPA: hypothetical protein VHM31_09835 [Polyangia bacterium]|nr:hypothetical protein [Polyangia bacterium]